MRYNKELIREWFKDRNLIIVTNREPYIHTYNEDGDISCSIPAGGVTAAMDPIMQDLNATWVAWGNGNADMDEVDDKNHVPVPPSRPRYTLRRVWLTHTEVKNYYLGYCNEGLWPLSHNLLSKVRFEKKQWNYYQQVNSKFAQAVLEECRDN
ncbi:MAG: trehalose-6-phosphate synthase, partial [bacterium]